MSSRLRKLRRNPSRRLLEEWLASVGVTLDGQRPVDMRVTNDDFFEKALPRGTAAVLNAYVDGWWECERLDELAARILTVDPKLPAIPRLQAMWGFLRAWLTNRQTRQKSAELGHYDLGNDLFAAMLDRRMIYSCAYWRDATNLDEAQEAKLRLVCRKARIQPGDRVLDIGCGWGGFARFAAERHGASVLGVTLSQNQAELGTSRCKGLPVELSVQDYRDLDLDPVDAVVSIGMFEHVGPKNYRRFMQIVRRCLKPDGTFVLHTIGGPTSRRAIDPWVNDNIFPSAVIPSAHQIIEARSELLQIEDWHIFGPDYDRTLMAWWTRFDSAWRRGLKDSFDDRFYRLWRCYLLTCAGVFRARQCDVWQIVMSPPGRERRRALIR